MAGKASLPVNQPATVTPARAKLEIQARFNPLRGMTPARITRLLEEFDRGLLRDVAWTMDKVERLDDMVRTVSLKRKKAVARQDWAIRPYESWEELGSKRELDRQTRFLRHLFNSLRATHALDRNTSGGVRRAIMQMADAIGKGYATHEITWRPRRDGLLEATVTFVPLWFWENSTGVLRFLPDGRSSQGVEVDSRAWMVTTGDALMLATLVAYVFKSLPIKDWLTYSERCGMPFPSMATDAQPGTKEWDQAVQAIAAVAAEFGAVHSRSAEFQVHDLTAKGELPYPPLVERMDRAIAMLWRGADLSTLSGEDQMGASLQQGESDILIEDDVHMINETMEQSLSLPALRWGFGLDVRPMCYFALAAPDRLDEQSEQTKLHAAADYGVKIGVSDYRERLHIPGGDDDDANATLTPPATPSPTAGFGQMANAAPERGPGIDRRWLAPVADLMAELERRGGEGPLDPEDLARALDAAADRLPELFGEMDIEAFADVLEAHMGAGVIAGMRESLERDRL